MRQETTHPEESWLRGRFAESRQVKAFTTGDGHLFPNRGEIREAAVLVPVVDRDGRPVGLVDVQDLIAMRVVKE